MSKIISETQRYALGSGVEVKFISQPFDEKWFLVGVYAQLPNGKVKLTETEVIKEILGVDSHQMVQGNAITSESDAITMSNRFSVAMRNGKYDDDIIEEVVSCG